MESDRKSKGSRGPPCGECLFLPGFHLKKPNVSKKKRSYIIRIRNPTKSGLYS